MKRLLMLLSFITIMFTGCGAENYSEQLNQGFGEAENQFRSKPNIQAVAFASNYEDNTSSIKFRFLVKQRVNQEEASELVKQFLTLAQEHSSLDQDILSVADITFDIYDSNGTMLFGGSKKKKEKEISWSV